MKMPQSRAVSVELVSHYQVLSWCEYLVGYVNDEKVLKQDFISEAR